MREVGNYRNKLPAVHRWCLHRDCQINQQNTAGPGSMKAEKKWPPISWCAVTVYILSLWHSKSQSQVFLCRHLLTASVQAVVAGYLTHSNLSPDGNRSVCLRLLIFGCVAKVHSRLSTARVGEWCLYPKPCPENTVSQRAAARNLLYKFSGLTPL